MSRYVPVAETIASAAQAIAQTYPAKPIRVIVPVAAGGNLDLVVMDDYLYAEPQALP